MTASNLLKSLLTGVATLALAGAAVAQSTPPTTASPNAATGAGQQSTQNTPMGATGTPGANTGTGATGGTGSAGNTGTGATGSGSGSAAGSSMGSGSSTDSGSMSGSTRPARADRN